MPIDYPDQRHEPQRERGGFFRNAKGEALIRHAPGGRRLIACGGSDLNPWDVYDGPEHYGMRGQLVHDIAEHADRGKPLDDEMFARGKALEMSAQLMQYIYDGWLVLLADRGWTVKHIELPVVNLAIGMASNIDRIIIDADGTESAVDIKSAGDVVKRSYLLQGTAYVNGSQPYDQDADHPLEWDVAPVADVFYIAWFPVNVARKEPDPTLWPTWSTIKVYTHPQALDELIAQRDRDDHHGRFDAPVFATKIAAPLSSPEVEPHDEGAGTHGTAPAPSSTPDPQRRAQLLARHAALTPEQRERFVMPDDRTDLDAIERAIAVAQRPPAAPERPVVPSNPDDGPAVASDAIDALKAAHSALDAAGKSWVANIVNEAKRAGVAVDMSPAAGGVYTVRRWEVWRGLITLAGGGFDNDDALRGCAHAAIGAELADSLAISHGQLVGCMNHEQAAVFANTAVALVDGGASMSFTDTQRCRVAA